ncbi:MAG: RDD family protein [Nocardioides sp.]
MTGDGVWRVASLPATWPRRTAALAIDWMASTLVAIAIIGPQQWLEGRASGFVTLAVFAVESAVLTTLTGASFGKLICRLRVIRPATGRPPDLLRALARQLLVCLVVPPLIFKDDGRGLHDLFLGTTTLRLPPTT